MSEKADEVIVAGGGPALGSPEELEDSDSKPLKPTRRRTLLIALGILIGIGALVAIIVVAVGLSSSTEKPKPPLTCKSLEAKSDVVLFYDKLVLNDYALDDITFEIGAASSTTSFSFSIEYDATNSTESVMKKVEQLQSTAVDETFTHDTKFVVEGLSTNGCSSSTRSVHVTIPSTVKMLCGRGDECRPVMCPLSLDYNQHSRYFVSGAPSNNELLFGTSKDCTVVKPTFWDEWVELHFSDLNLGPNFAVSYFDDWDEDGLSNIVEYYGLSLISIFINPDNITSNATNPVEQRRLRSLLPVMPQGSDPLSQDSDGDLLTDGFEWMSGLDMNVPSPIDTDTDSDGMSDFEEQKYRTNPLLPDSDFDGKPDKTEVDQGSNPNDDTNSKPDPYTVQVQLEIGDPSGSHSERWGLQVGSILHSAPTYGEMGTGTYTMRTGVHTVTIIHQGSNLATPDYDYRANIFPASNPDLTVTIEDPQGILGSHSESSYNYAAGKSAILRIEKNEEDICSHKTCASCNQDSECSWSSSSKTCQEKSFFEFSKSASDCACEKCKAWAKKEMEDLDWINKLTRCPCQVEMKTDEIVTSDGNTWDEDSACYPGNTFLKCKYHPGATGCIRKDGQQCCYDSQGKLIVQGMGAGTPDKSTGLYGHWRDDVTTFSDCCVDCEIPEVCELYIGGEEQGARSDPRSKECGQ